ncbi:MAG: MFS transporter [Candidatus Pacearchaeota archaeon]
MKKRNIKINKKKLEKDNKKEELIKKSKSHSLKDAAFVNATVGFGDSYISPYMIELKATNQQIAALTSIPNLIAPLAQLFTSKLMKKYSRKRIFSIAILIQSILWIPIILVSILFLKDIKYAPLLVIIFWTVYASLGNLAAPAWSSWLGDLIKKEEFGRFFGLRNKIGGIIALISMLIAGIILDKFKFFSGITNNQAWIFFGFSIIFLFAMIFRLISRYYVLQQYEPAFKFQEEYYFSFFQFVKKAPFNNFGRFSIYIAFIVLVTNISSPFYSIYMLRVLNFSYSKFILINISATIASFIFMPIWGRFADKFGNITMLKITSFLIPLICFAWLINPNFSWFFYFILVANFISGFSWAGFNLAAGNFVYDAATPQRRSLCVAYTSVLNGAGVFIGATIGGLLATHLPEKVLIFHKLMFISLISGILRYAFAFLLVFKIKEVREIKQKVSWKDVPLVSEIYNINNFLLREFPLLVKKPFKRIKI